MLHQEKPVTVACQWGCDAMTPALYAAHSASLRLRMILGESVDQLLKETPPCRSRSRVDFSHPSIFFQRISCAQGHMGAAVHCCNLRLEEEYTPGKQRLCILRSKRFLQGQLMLKWRKIKRFGPKRKHKDLLPFCSSVYKLN